MEPIRVGIAGLGAVGRAVARALRDGIGGHVLAAAASGDRSKAEAWLAAEGIAAPVLDPSELPAACDLVLESAPAAAFDAIVRPALAAGRTAVVLSAAALLSRPDLPDLARSAGGRIVVPTGALLGLDAVAAAAEGTIRSVRLVTRKPPRGLAGAPHLVRAGLSVEGLREPLMVFRGSAREAAVGFPANVNVAAALSLAGIGPDRTEVEVWADPAAERNCHSIEVEADSASFRMSIEGVPSENPKTGRITALSAVACLRRMGAVLRVGT